MDNGSEIAIGVSNSTAQTMPALPDSGLGSIWQTAGTLVFVVCLMLVVLYLLKRYGPSVLTKVSDGNAPILKGQLAFGPKQRVAVVEIDGRKFLLGVTETHISNLAELSPTAGSQSAEVEEPGSSEMNTDGAAGQASELQQILLDEAKRRRDAQQEAFTRALDNEKEKN
ncbi:MAG: flagellar biosynthetic protein FliO [Desulfovibrio sp.]